MSDDSGCTGNNGDSNGGENADHNVHTDHDWPVIESVAEYETGWYTGGYDLVRQPDGSEKRYYWAELPPAVVVVATSGEEMVFVEQYRPAIGEGCLELPAGIVEDGESYTTAGARETPPGSNPVSSRSSRAPAVV